MAEPVNSVDTNWGLRDPDLLRTHAFVAGEWVGADDGSTFPVYNPSNGHPLAEVANLGSAETRRAIEAAESAGYRWAAETSHSRSVILRRWHELMVENLEDLAIIMTLEQGKALAESRVEIASSASYIEWYSEEAKRIYGEVLPQPQADRRGIVIKQPVGVCAAITPWNFPSAMLARKAAPALAVGCSMVAKPAAETPLSMLAIAVLAERAGLPAGLLSVVPTNRSQIVGEELCTNPAVRKLTFTGSTDVGKKLTRQCADTLKRLSMELGGNSPVIVFEDADLDLAAQGAAASKFRNSGQTCICANRILVQGSVHDRFVEKLKDIVSTYKVGDGLDESVTHGPLITKTAVAGVKALVDDALSKGATIVAGERFGEDDSLFVDPAILCGVTDEMKIFHQEIFGPVAPIYKFQSEDEAIAIANDTSYGLASYIFAESPSRIWRVSEALDYGMVGVNETMISSAYMPFGGVKESGQGREGSHHGAEEYLETKYICLGNIRT